MAVKKGAAEITKGGFYPTDTFIVLRFQAEPIVQLAEPGDYVIKFQYKGQAVSSFPFREGIPLKTSITATLSHGGKVVANTLPHTLHEGHNTRFGTKLFVPGGRTPFTKVDLQKLNGAVTWKIASASKTL